MSLRSWSDQLDHEAELADRDERFERWFAVWAPRLPDLTRADALACWREAWRAARHDGWSGRSMAA